jgi:hypothetical protein
MARVAEQAYRRDVQQGAGLAGKPSFRGDLWEWRYRPSLDLSPWVDSPTTTTGQVREVLEIWVRESALEGSVLWPVLASYS